MPSPFTLRWGIISTGKIATVVTKDLLLDADTRGVNDVVHKVVAVGSRSRDSAQKFIDEVCGGDSEIRACGSYEEVYRNPDVDVIYIGTPHTYHYINALDAIKAKKHILCEKPVTSNAAELRSLLDAARENNVFFMEAMWTRFQPLSLELKKFVDGSGGGELGMPVVLQADLSGDFDIDQIPKTHRILDPNLGGGGLLDLGPYPLVWAIMHLYEHPANQSSKPSSISGQMLKTPLTGVDVNTSFSLIFDKIPAQAILSTSINLKATNTGVVIRFEKGTITIPSPIYRPTSYTVQYHNHKGVVYKEETKNFDYVGGGWHWQADEVARCIRDGKKESALWGWDKSLVEMEIFDEVRKQGGYKLPPGVEQVLD